MSQLQNSWAAIGFLAPAHFQAAILLHGTTLHLIPSRKWTRSEIAPHPSRVLQLAQ